MTATMLQTPGALIVEHIKALGLQQQIVAAIAHIDPTQFSRMLSGKRPIDIESALRLQAAIEIDANELLSLQLKSDITKATACFSEAATIKAARSVYTAAPIPDMVRRGWLPEIATNQDIRNPSKVEGSLKKFFSVNSINDIPAAVEHAAKKTHETTPTTPAQRAWIGRARKVASAVQLSAKYQEAHFTEMLEELRPLLRNADDVQKVVSVLAKFGIRLIFVEKLNSSKIDGACFLINGDPVIAMSLRFDRIDNFWFILLHELDHVHNGDGTTLIALDDAELMNRENRADSALVKFIDPQDAIQNYVKKHSFSNAGVCELANTLQIHPGLVAGQIQHQTGNYSIFRQFLVKIRSTITDLGTNVDGWGRLALTN